MLDGSEALTAGIKLNGYEILQFMGRRDPFTLAYRVRDSSGAEYEMREYFPEEFLRRVDGRLEAVSEAVQTTLRWGVIEFVNEAQVLAGLSEPALPRVQAVFETNGSAYYVRSLFSGRTLAQLLESPSFGNELSTVIKVMKALGSSLAVAHKEGFLHRSICPERIGFRDDGSPMLLDCGAGANAVRFKSHYLNQIVQPGYAALEDYSPTGRQGPWTDVHALAVVAYRWLSGSLPPPANARSRGQLAEPLSRLAPQIPAEIANAIEWGMALNAASRPQTLTEWLRGLEQGVSSNRSQAGSFSDTALSGVTTLPASSAGLVKAPKADKELVLQTETVAAPAKRKSPTMMIGAVAVALIGVAGAAMLILGGGGSDEGGGAVETVAEPAAAVAQPAPAEPSSAAAVAQPTPAAAESETRSSSIEDVARMMMIQQMKAAEDADKQAQLEQQRVAEAEAARKAQEEAAAREAELAARLAAQEAELKAQQVATSSQSEAVNLALQQQKLREKLLAEQRAKQEAEAKAAAAAAAKAAESRQTDDKRVAEQVAKARANCRIAAPDLSVDGKLLYENAMKVPGATQVGKAIRLPEIRMQDGRYVRFEVLPDNCARLIR